MFIEKKCRMPSRVRCERYFDTISVIICAFIVI